MRADPQTRSYSERRSLRSAISQFVSRPSSKDHLSLHAIAHNLAAIVLVALLVALGTLLLPLVSAGFCIPVVFYCYGHSAGRRTPQIKMTSTGRPHYNNRLSD